MSECNERLVEISRNGYTYLPGYLEITAKLPRYPTNFANVLLFNTSLQNIIIAQKAQTKGQATKNEIKAVLLSNIDPMGSKLVASATLTTTKPGYKDKTTNVNVVAGGNGFGNYNNGKGITEY